MLDSERIAPSQKVLLDSVGHRKFYWTALLHMGKKKKITIFFPKWKTLLACQCFVLEHLQSNGSVLQSQELS